MGPKRARSSSPSSLSSSGSQGEDVVDHTKFLNLEAQQEYYKIVTKTFVKERGFKPGQQDGHLCPMIRERGWLGFIATPTPISMSIVREFYANAKVTRSCVSLVRDFEIDYKPPAIRAIFRLTETPPTRSAN